MSGTAKTILIVAGVGVGAYALLKLFAPRPTAAAGYRPGTNGSTSVLSVGGLVQLGTSLAGLLGDKPSGVTPVTTVDSRAQAAYGLSHGVVEQEGNQLIDLNTGNALVYGPGF